MSDIRFTKLLNHLIKVELSGNNRLRPNLGFWRGEWLFEYDITAQELRAIADELDRRNGVKDETE